MPWSFSVVDYGVREDGTAVVYEIQPYIFVVPGESRLSASSGWSVIGADSPYSRRYEVENRSKLFARMGLSPVGQIEMYNDPMMLQDKVMQRRFMKADPALSSLNPPFVTCKVSDEIWKNHATYKYLYEKTPKDADGLKHFVLKLPSASRGDGNFFFKASSYEDFLFQLEMVINNPANQFTVRTSHYGFIDVVSKPLSEYENEVSLEGCVNPVAVDGKRTTHRVVLAHDTESGRTHVVPTTAWEHRGFNSHAKTLRRDFITGVEYDLEHNVPRPISEGSEAFGITPEITQVLSDLGRKVAEKQQMDLTDERASLHCKVKVRYDEEVGSSSTLNTFIGDLDSLHELVYSFAENKKEHHHKNTNPFFNSELADFVHAQLDTTDYPVNFGNKLVQTLGRTRFPTTSEGTELVMPDLTVMMRRVSNLCETKSMLQLSGQRMKRLFLGVEYSHDEARYRPFLPLTTDNAICPNLFINICLRRAINELKDIVEGVKCKAVKGDKTIVTVTKGARDERLFQQLIEIEEQLDLDKQPENHFHAIHSQLNAVVSTIMIKYHKHAKCPRQLLEVDKLMYKQAVYAKSAEPSWEWRQYAAEKASVTLTNMFVKLQPKISMHAVNEFRKGLRPTDSVDVQFKLLREKLYLLEAIQFKQLKNCWRTTIFGVTKQQRMNGAAIIEARELITALGGDLWSDTEIQEHVTGFKTISPLAFERKGKPPEAEEIQALKAVAVSARS